METLAPMNALELHNRCYFDSGDLADVVLRAFGRTWRLHRFCALVKNIKKTLMENK